MKKILALLLAACLLLSLAACSDDDEDDDSNDDADTETAEPADTDDDDDADEAEEDSSSSAQEGGSLTVVATGDIANHTPMQMNATNEYAMSYSVYEGLTVAYNGDWDDVRGALAEDWDITEDGLTYTFYLREGVKFHDGSDFTSRDVIATFDNIKSVQASYFTPVDSYEAVDDYTVVMELNAPYPDLINRLASFYWGIMSADALEGGDNNDAAIGTGPYYIDSYTSGDNMTLKKFDDYWDTDNAAIIDEVVFDIITDANTATVAMQSGDVDMILDATALQYTTIQSTSGYDTFSMVTPSVVSMKLNTATGIFSDKAVREAMSYLIEREQLNDAAYDGLADVAGSYWSSISPFYVDDGYEYDVDKGLEILADAGYAPEDISFEIVVPETPAYVAAANNVQAQLYALGMDVEVTPYDWGAIISITNEGRFDACIMENGANIYAPGSSLNLCYNSQGTQYVNFFNENPDTADFQAEMDDMIADMLTATTLEESYELGVEISARFEAEYANIPLLELSKYVLYNENLEGMVYDTSSGYPRFNQAYWAA